MISPSCARQSAPPTVCQPLKPDPLQVKSGLNDSPLPLTSPGCSCAGETTATISHHPANKIRFMQGSSSHPRGHLKIYWLWVALDCTPPSGTSILAAHTMP